MIIIKGKYLLGVSAIKVLLKTILTDAGES
jgi:hypothetical protein